MRWIALISILFIVTQPALASLKKCVDDDGMFHYYAQIMPPECRDKKTIEMNKLGVVIRTHDVEEKPGPADDSEQKAVKEQVKIEADRRDSVLLNTYTSEKEIDWTLERNVHPLELAIVGIEKRLEIAVNQLRGLQHQVVEAKKSDNPMLASIQQSMISVRRDVAQLQNELKKNRERLKHLKEKFAADKKHFQKLKTQKLSIQ